MKPLTLKPLTLTLAALAVMAAASASAQEPGKSDWDRIVLEGKGGNVMTSTGGDYKTAQVGDELSIGQYMLLGEATTAKVVYYELDDDGKVLRKCVRDYKDPNTYIIDAVCNGAAAWADGGAISGTQIGLIIGGGMLGAALLNGGDNADVGPISTGPRRP